MKHSQLLAARVLTGLLAGCLAFRAAAGPGQDMADAARHFLDALTPEQQTKATYAFDNEERYDWHFIPKERKGLPYKEMTSAQQKLAQAFLASGMSQRGYIKAVTIMSLEQVLHELENNNPKRDPDMYFFTVFGQPNPKDVWGWRVEGHHLSLNFVVKGDAVVSATPAFFGTNPAEVRTGPRKGLSVLGEEDTLGREFMKSLDESQRKTAIVTNESPREIITGNSRKVEFITPAGLPVSAMNAAQKTALHELIRNYAYRHRPEVAEGDLQKIEAAGFEKVSFAWAGVLEPGGGHYYRIQGPTFVIEFDNTQDKANHAHTVWRDFAGDFGEDILRKHYDEVPHAK